MCTTLHCGTAHLLYGWRPGAPVVLGWRAKPFSAGAPGRSQLATLLRHQAHVAMQHETAAVSFARITPAHSLNAVHIHWHCQRAFLYSTPGPINPNTQPSRTLLPPLPW